MWGIVAADDASPLQKSIKMYFSKCVYMKQTQLSLRDSWMMIILHYQVEFKEESCLMLIHKGLLKIQM
jgi:hypothetical protein